MKIRTRTGFRKTYKHHLTHPPTQPDLRSPDLVPEVAGQLEVTPRVPALPLAEVVEPRRVQVAKTYVGTILFHHEFIKTARITKYATWDGSFSAVTDRNVGKKISCFTIFRDLHKDQIDLEKFPDFCNCSDIFLFLARGVSEKEEKRIFFSNSSKVDRT